MNSEGGLLRCVQVRRETHDVKSFIFEADDPAAWAYLPGQFVTFELSIEGERINRCYTLSSTPTRPERLSITVKRVPGGKVSNWLHDTLRVGDSLSALGPAGEFSCFVKPAASYLFFSGGSGVTPLMSMSRALHDRASTADIVFVHAARTPADVLFAEELALLAKNMPQFRVALVVEGRGADPAWPGYTGRLSAGLIANIAPDFLSRDVYTCGPAPFMNAVRTQLAAAGFDMARYREESFNFETLKPAEPGAGAAPAEPAAAHEPQHRIRLNKLGDEFSCSAGQTILQAADQADIRMPYSCANGICGTCKTLKISGDVEMNHGAGIRKREIDQGWILPCCSKPRSDVVLDR